MTSRLEVPPCSFIRCSRYLCRSELTASTTWEAGKTYISKAVLQWFRVSRSPYQPEFYCRPRRFGSQRHRSYDCKGAKIWLKALQIANYLQSVSDNLIPVRLRPNLAPTMNGLWGGLLILGRAPISAEAEAMQIEGIPASDLTGFTRNRSCRQFRNTEGMFPSSWRRQHTGRERDKRADSWRCRLRNCYRANRNVSNQMTELNGSGDGKCEECSNMVTPGRCHRHRPVMGRTLDNFIVINPGDECLELDGPEGTMVRTYP